MIRNVNIILDLLARARNTFISQERYEDADKIQQFINDIIDDNNNIKTMTGNEN